MRQKQEPDDLFGIDSDRLEEEWFQHPRRFRKLALEAADAREYWERMKARKDVVYAEVEKDVRQDPESYGLDKITESSVAGAVQLSKRYQKAVTLVIRAKHLMDIADVAVSTMDHKKKALEKAVDLWLAGYFATPRSKRMREHQERTPAFDRRKK